MACRKLNITDFFRFAETKKIIDYEVTDLCFAEQKINAHFEYSPFWKITKTTGSIANRFVFRFSSEYTDTESSLVYYNYRYYSPELGRWLSRDPINQMGSIAWMMDNSIRIQLKKQLLRVNMYLDLVYSLNFRSDVLNKVLSLLNHYKLAVQYQLQLDLLGKRNNGNNDNPYSFVGNNGVNDWDELGEGDTWDSVKLTAELVGGIAGGSLLICAALGSLPVWVPIVGGGLLAGSLGLALYGLGTQDPNSQADKLKDKVLPADIEQKPSIPDTSAEDESKKKCPCAGGGRWPWINR